MALNLPSTAVKEATMSQQNPDDKERQDQWKKSQDENMRDPRQERKPNQPNPNQPSGQQDQQGQQPPQQRPQRPQDPRREEDPNKRRSA
jgi:hypothetical protein